VPRNGYLNPTVFTLICWLSRWCGFYFRRDDHATCIAGAVAAQHQRYRNSTTSALLASLRLSSVGLLMLRERADLFA
jgi:hypothetical protein